MKNGAAAGRTFGFFTGFERRPAFELAVRLWMRRPFA
jgi:hypothetical protein